MGMKRSAMLDTIELHLHSKFQKHLRPIQQMAMVYVKLKKKVSFLATFWDFRCRYLWKLTSDRSETFRIAFYDPDIPTTKVSVFFLPIKYIHRKSNT